MGKVDSLRWDNRGMSMFKGETVVFCFVQDQGKKRIPNLGPDLQWMQLGKRFSHYKVSLGPSYGTGKLRSFPARPSTLAKRLDLALRGYGGVRADCGGLWAPRIRPWRPSRRHRSAPSPALASATIVLQAADSVSHPLRSPRAGLLCFPRLPGRAPAAFHLQGAFEPCCPAASLLTPALGCSESLRAHFAPRRAMSGRAP